MKSGNTIIKLFTPLILLFVLWAPRLARSQAAAGAKNIEVTPLLIAAQKKTPVGTSERAIGDRR
jgi:hypothetical protein